MDPKLSRKPPQSLCLVFGNGLFFFPPLNHVILGTGSEKTPRRKMTVRRWTLLPLKLSRLGPPNPTAFAAAWRHPKKAELYAVNPTDLAECEASTRRTSHLGVTFDRFFGVLGSWKLLFFLEGARLWEGWWYQLPHWFPHCKKLSSDASQMTDLNEMKTCIFRHIFIQYTSTYCIHVHLCLHIPWMERSVSLFFSFFRWGLDQLKSQQLWYQTYWKVNSVETQLLPGANLTLRWLRWFCLTKYEVKVTAGRIIPALAMALNGLPLCFFCCEVKMYQNGSTLKMWNDSWVLFFFALDWNFFSTSNFF